MKRPSEADYTSQVAYTRALEAYCDAKREWVGLTDEEMKRTCYEACSYDPYAIARAIEAALRGKNT